MPVAVTSDGEIGCIPLGEGKKICKTVAKEDCYLGIGMLFQRFSHIVISTVGIGKHEDFHFFCLSFLYKRVFFLFMT